MIQGAKYWNDRERLHIQENNSFEILVPGLEYCGPTAAVNCLDALGLLPNWLKIQAEDYLTAFFLDKNNWEMFHKIRPLPYGLGPGQYPPNEIPQIYPWAVKQCFNADALYKEGGIFEDVAKLVWDGNAVQLCIPGHFIAAVAYDAATIQNGFKDSWMGDRWPSGDSLPDANNNKWFGKADFARVERWYIVYQHK